MVQSEKEGRMDLNERIAQLVKSVAAEIVALVRQDFQDRVSAVLGSVPAAARPDPTTRPARRTPAKPVKREPMGRSTRTPDAAT